VCVCVSITLCVKWLFNLAYRYQKSMNVCLFVNAEDMDKCIKYLSIPVITNLG